MRVNLQHEITAAKISMQLRGKKNLGIFVEFWYDVYSFAAFPLLYVLYWWKKSKAAVHQSICLDKISVMI